MEIRYITPEEAADFLKVSSASFIWKFNDAEDNSVKGPVLAAFHSGKLIAGVELYDFKSNYCGNFLNSLVISGVCCLPEYRRMGAIREIFDKISSIAVQDNVSLGFLHPFSISYYEKFGFSNLNRMFKIRVPFESLKAIPRNTDVTLYTGEQFEELSLLHNKCALRENLTTLRNDKKHFCDRPLHETDYTYISRDNSGQANGYVRFTVNRPETLEVKELFVLSPEALYTLTGFLRNYDGIVKSLIVQNQYQGSVFSCFADRLENVSYEYNGGIAAKIYDIKAVLEANKYPDAPGNFRLFCSDTAERNNGVFEVEFGNGKVCVNHKKEGKYDISLTAAAASRILLAGEGHNAQTAVFIDGVDIVNNSDDFFRSFPFRQTRFCESDWSL